MEENRSQKITPTFVAGLSQHLDVPVLTAGPARLCLHIPTASGEEKTILLETVTEQRRLQTLLAKNAPVLPFSIPAARDSRVCPYIVVSLGEGAPDGFKRGETVESGTLFSQRLGVHQTNLASAINYARAKDPGNRWPQGVIRGVTFMRQRDYTDWCASNGGQSV